MKTKVKLMMSDRLSKLESEVNDFIETNQIEIVDLKIAAIVHAVVCSIVYIEQDK